MLRKIVRPVLLLLLISCGYQCRRTNDASPLLTGRLVASYDCIQKVIQITGGPFDSSRVQSGWTDTTTDSVYHNVFRLGAVRDLCGLGGNIAKGDTFTFRIDPHPQNLVCYVCAVLRVVDLPTVTNSIMDVQKTSVTIH
jgi:hypothetical protein